MNKWIAYGLSNAALGLAIGISVAVTAIGEGYSVMAIAAPAAAFLTGGICWSLLMRGDSGTGRSVITGLLTGTVAHYIAFLFLLMPGLWGEEALTIGDLLTGSLGLTFFSVMFFGWITVPFSIFTAKLLSRKKS